MPAVRVDFIAQFAQFQDSLNQIKRAVDKNVGGLSKGFGDLNSVIAGLGVSLSAGGFIAFVKSAINAQDEMGKMAQRVGVTSESLSALEHAARLSDVSLESLGQSMKRLSANMLETQSGGGEAKEAFKALGIEVTNSSGQLRGADRVLFDIADKFAGMEDGAGKTALAMRLFGRAGADLIPLLNQGADGLKRSADEAKRFGLIISTEAAKKAEEFNDNLTRIAQSSKGLGIALANDLLPWLSRMIEQFLEGTRIAGSFLGAIRLFGFSTITSDNAGQRIKEINQELERLRELQKAPPPGAGKAMLERVNADVKDLEKRLEFAKFLQRQAALAGAAGDTPGEQARLRSRLAPAPKLIDEKAAKEAEALLEKFNDKLRALQDQAARALGADRAVDEIKRLVSTDKDFKRLSESQKAALIAAAERVDQEKDFILLLKQESEAQEQLAKDTAEAWSFVQPMLDKLKNRERLENIFGDEALGLSTEDLQTKLDQMLQSIDFMAEEFDNAARAAAGFDEQGRRIADDSDKIKALARDIGLTFSSAFEDAVAGGKKLRDVLEGLVQDLARLAARKFVTEPIMKGASGFFESMLSGAFSGLFSGFSGGGGGGGMGAFVSDSGGRRSAGDLLMVGRVPGGELWVPDTAGTMIPTSKLADTSGGPTFVIDARGADVAAVSRLERMVMQLHGTFEQRAVNAVVSATTRGGAAGIAIRGA